MNQATSAARKVIQKMSGAPDVWTVAYAASLGLSGLCFSALALATSRAGAALGRMRRRVHRSSADVAGAAGGPGIPMDPTAGRAEPAWR
jgi:hypothetical protein